MNALANLDDYGVWIAAVVGGLVALGWLAKKTRQGIREIRHFTNDIRKVLRVADHQLTNNGGTSLLDKVDRIERNLDAVTEVVDGLAERFDDHLTTLAEANRAMWPAVEQIAKSTPPDAA